jgi:chromosome segregation ATPase
MLTEVPLADDALTLMVLTEIRDELRSTRVDLNSRLDETNSRLDETNSRLDETNKRLDEANGSLGEANGRLGHLETAMVELAQQQSFVVRWLKAGTRRDRRIQDDLVKLTARVDAIESRLPDAEE